MPLLLFTIEFKGQSGTHASYLPAARINILTDPDAYTRTETHIFAHPITYNFPGNSIFYSMIPLTPLRSVYALNHVHPLNITQPYAILSVANVP